MVRKLVVSLVLSGICGATAFFAVPTEAAAPVIYGAEEATTTPERVPQEVTEATLRDYLERRAGGAGISYRPLAAIVTCETGGTWDPLIQSNHLYSFSDPSRGIVRGEQEQSYGLAQIHLPDHDVTYEQATDPEFALDFLVEEVAAGRMYQWSCARILGLVY